MSKTSITFLLDRSGSMKSILDDTLGGFNAYVDGLRDAPDALFSLLTFDSNSVDKVFTHMPVKEVPALTKKTYVPGASTPLIDAVVKTIRAIERSVTDPADKVVMAILTDGEENSSREFTWDDLTALIKEKTAAGWQFVFLGAGIDAYEQGARMGIDRGATMSYNSANPAATRAAFRATAQSVSSYVSGEAASASFSAEQKQEAGDKFWDAQAGQPAIPAPVAAHRAGPPTPRTPVVPTVDDIEL